MRASVLRDELGFVHWNAAGRTWRLHLRNSAPHRRTGLHRDGEPSIGLVVGNPPLRVISRVEREWLLAVGFWRLSVRRARA